MKDLRFYGKLITADFDEKTMTFEIENEMVVQAGEYVILTLNDYGKLVNGAEQSANKCNLQKVSQQSEMLNAFFEYLDSLPPKEYDANSLTEHGENWLKSI